MNNANTTEITVVITTIRVILFFYITHEEYNLQTKAGHPAISNKHDNLKQEDYLR